MIKRRLLPLLSLLCLSPLTMAQEIAITFDDAPLPGSKVMSGEDKTKSIIKPLKGQQNSGRLVLCNSKKHQYRSR